MRPRSSVRHHKLGLIGLAVFAVAFAVRAYWVLRVQGPLDAVWSDMAGYVTRADLLLAGKVPGEPRILAMWPWGTHTLLAGEFLLFGRTSATGIGLCHAAVGALAAPCASMLTARFVAGRLAPALAGVVVAFWHPHVIYSGYFSSELWFTTLSMLATVFLVRHSEARRGALAAGVFFALAFVVRPQILLTVILVAVSIFAARLRSRRALALSPSAAAALLLPLCIAMGASSMRLHQLTGRYGLIAANERVQRLFGATDVVKVAATWTAANGERWNWWFNRTKDIPTPATTETFEGFISDPEILERIQQRRLEGVGFGARVSRMSGNLVGLTERPWPEQEFRIPFRRALQRNYAYASYVVLAFAVVGLRSLRRHRVAAAIVLAHLATIIYVGAFYLGEGRYRVPYDPILIVVGVAGLWTVGRFIARRAFAHRRS
jgi:hypothetical protein